MKNINKVPEEILKKYRGIRTDHIFEVPDMVDEYVDYAENLDKKIFPLGFKHLDDDLFRGGIRPGQVATIISETNVGKTTFAMNVLRYYSQKKTEFLKENNIAMFSMEESKRALFQRYMQMQLGVYAHELEAMYKSKNEDRTKLLREYSEQFRGIINIVYRIKGTEIMAYLMALEDMYEKKVGAVILDHVSLIRGDRNSNDYEKLTENMMLIRETAVQMDIPILDFSQVARSQAKTHAKKMELNLNSGKGSGEIENSSHILMSLTRVNESSGIEEGLVREIESSKKDLLLLKIHKLKEGFYGETQIIVDKRSTVMTEYTKPPVFSF